jgi:hypothetical protein
MYLVSAKQIPFQFPSYVNGIEGCYSELLSLTMYD